jgi:hypothetical protein
MTTSAEVQRGFLPAGAAIPAAVVAAAAAGIAADAVIALIAHRLGVPKDFRPLQAGSFAALTVLGVLAGAIGWAIIGRRSGTPGRVLARLVPIVVAVSLIPDLLLKPAGLEAHATWGGVAALMIMHLAVAACAVTAYRLLLPLPRGRQPAARSTAARPGRRAGDAS